MRPLLLGCMLLGASSGLLAQTPAPPAQGRQTAPAPAPAPARPATQTPPRPAAPPARRAAPAPARGTLSIFVTTMTGMPIDGVRVQAFGPTERGGTTDTGGRLTITGMQPGTYRLRFLNEEFVEFEREVAVRGGNNPEVDVSLRPAPPPKIVTVTAPPPPAPEPPAPVIGPVGQPQVIPGLAALVTKAFLDGPRREALISCSANTRVTLVQMSQDQPTRLYENAEVIYYVLGGEGAVQIDGRETALKQESLVSLPRGTAHALLHRGRRNVPLVMVMQLSGEPCEAAK